MGDRVRDRAREWQGPPGSQVQPRRQTADVVGQGRHRRPRTRCIDSPTDVVVAPNGDIFVADGHTGKNNRIVKFTKEGKFIKEWGKQGTGPGEFSEPHCIAMDSRGRVIVGDRNNNRIQIFDQEGKFVDAWTQFGRPSGLFIGKDDTLFVIDSESRNVSGQRM